MFRSSALTTAGESEIVSSIMDDAGVSDEVIDEANGEKTTGDASVRIVYCIPIPVKYRRIGLKNGRVHDIIL